MEPREVRCRCCCLTPGAVTGAAWLVCPTPGSAALLPARHRARIAVVRPPRCRGLREWRSSRQRGGRLTRQVADPIAPVVAERAITFGGCDRPPAGAACCGRAMAPARP